MSYTYSARTKILRIGEGRAAFAPLPGVDVWARDIGEEWLALEVKLWKPRRSLPQNAMFHAICGEIARLTGMDAGLVKEGIKQAYGPRMEYHGMPVPKPTHLCTGAEMADLIRAAEVELVEAGGSMHNV
jgi:hypothetical protein